jgi:hypothetical protein
MPSLRLGGAKPPLPHKPSKRAQGKCPLILYRAVKLKKGTITAMEMGTKEQSPTCYRHQHTALTSQ